jgi:N-acetylglucosamine malate deacetylase 1
VFFDCLVPAETLSKAGFAGRVAGQMSKIALAIAAHPDDIEFMMAGTLLLLKEAGYETHYLNLASGSCGTTEHDAKTIKRIRLREAKAAAAILGARFHPPLVDDLEILYELPLLRRVAAVVRAVRPTVLLTHSPSDYMEDHTNACRLAVSAAFARGAPNFKSIPPRAAMSGEVTVYHALPHSLRDPLRRRIPCGSFVNIASVLPAKLAALEAHQSQRQWLASTQKFDSFVRTMVDIARKVGRMSGRFKHAEGWRRHLHHGFCDPKADPLRDLGRNYLINKRYERSLEAA